MNDKLSYEQDGEVAVITLDDGKVNVCGFAILDAINVALDRAQTQAAILARLYAPAAAVDVGFLDEVVAGEVLRATAIAKARELSTLDAAAFAATKLGFRGAAIARVLTALEA